MIALTNPDLLQETSYINGEWVSATDKIQITNPANGKNIASVPNLSRKHTKNAIEAAQNAFPKFSDLTAQKRAELLQKWYQLQIENQHDLARIMTAEMGKPIAESLAEITYGASFCAFFAEQARRIYGEIIPTHKKNARILTLRQPIGVCAAITPWNFPLAMITRKISPALAAGCTVVCKPASETPLTALALAQLAQEAGFPKGVINIITGNEVEIGKELTQNPIVRALSFTGSTQVGAIAHGTICTNNQKTLLRTWRKCPPYYLRRCRSQCRRRWRNHMINSEMRGKPVCVQIVSMCKREYIMHFSRPSKNESKNLRSEMERTIMLRLVRSSTKMQ